MRAEQSLFWLWKGKSIQPSRGRANGKENISSYGSGNDLSELNWLIDGDGESLYVAASVGALWLIIEFIFILFKTVLHRLITYLSHINNVSFK